jgi:hypothetical protein
MLSFLAVIHAPLLLFIGEEFHLVHAMIAILLLLVLMMKPYVSS